MHLLLLILLLKTLTRNCHIKFNASYMYLSIVQYNISEYLAPIQSVHWCQSPSDTDLINVWIIPTAEKTPRLMKTNTSTFACTKSLHLTLFKYNSQSVIPFNMFYNFKT